MIEDPLNFGEFKRLPPREREPLIDQGMELAERIQDPESKARLLESIAESYKASLNLICYVEKDEAPKL